MNTHEGSEARAVAIRAFKWILSAYEPLTLSGLGYAAAIRDDGVLDSEVDIDFVLDVCSNFVAIDAFQQPQFVHASVREFLEDLKIDDSKVYSERSVHTQAAKTCLVYLTSSMFLSALENSLFIGFPAYARRFWALHCRACEDNRKEDNVLQKFFLDFLSQEEVHPGFRRWHKCIQRTVSARPQDRRLIEQIWYSRYGFRPGIREMQDCLSPKPNPFLVACIFGFPELVEKHRTEERAMLESRNAVSLSGLTLACKYGQVDIALMLLKKGASVDTRDKGHGTPLHFVVFAENESLVRMLLEAGADVESRNEYGVTPLLIAVQKGFVPLVRVLLDFNANPNTTCQGKTCLEYANSQQAMYGDRGIAQLLRDAGATK